MSPFSAFRRGEGAFLRLMVNSSQKPLHNDEKYDILSPKADETVRLPLPIL